MIDITGPQRRRMEGTAEVLNLKEGETLCSLKQEEREKRREGKAKKKKATFVSQE